MGRSLGSGVASYNSKKEGVQGLILVTPYDSIEAVAKGQFPFLPVKLLLTEKFESYKYVNPEIPTLVLYANNDSIIPNKNTDELLKYINKKSKIEKMSNTDHNRISETPEYWNYINNFVSNI